MSKSKELKMEKLTLKDGETPDLIRENIAGLRQLFPEVFIDGRIDFEALKQTLGSYVEDSEERYSFTWHGKSRARRSAQTPSTGTLLPCREESVNWDTAQNIFIEGDNLEVLKLLQKSYHRRVKMIYIDPPYNTGREFIYPDKWQDNLDTYLRYTGQIDDAGFKTSTNTETSGRYHTNWLNMMYPRLKLARNLLRDDGSVWISIDDNEFANLRSLCDEIFGEENFVATFVWEKRTTRENRRAFSFNHDYIVCYAREKGLFEEARNFLPLGDEVLARYANPDRDPRGLWQSISLNAQAGHATKSQFYTLKTPGGRVIEPPPGRCWSVTETRMQELIADNRVWFGETGNNSPRKKSFLTEARDGLTPHTLWAAAEVGTTDSARKHLTSSLAGAEIFDTPKPVPLIERILQVATDPGDLVVDFFAGSGTLGEAVYNQNSGDCKSRRFILVQLPEKIESEAAFSTISDLALERLKRSISRLESTGQMPNLRPQNSDLGFLAFKLSSSNIKPWDSDFQEIEASLFDAVENIKPERSEHDVLYELILKYGLDLTVPVEENALMGRAVFVIGAGALVVCLATDIDLDVVRGVAELLTELAPETCRVVFKDSGFANDVVKTNAMHILKQAGVDDIKSL